jgi:hypothetical protein
MPIQSQQLKDLVARMAAHQTAVNLSDEKFSARYGRYIPSAKTWRQRLIKGDPGDIKDPAAWEAKFVNRLTAMAAEIDGVAMPDNFIKDHRFAREMSARLEILEHQQTDRRCLVGLAVTGCGKSVWAAASTAENPARRKYILANESWRENRCVIATRMAQMLGREPGKSQADAVESVREHLSLNPTSVFIDSAQEGGIALMKLIRAWIDGTRSCFIYLGYSTEWKRMVRARTGALDEAKQLLGRSLKPPYDEYADGIHVEDIKLWLRENGIANGALKDLAESILPDVRANGNLRFLDDALADARAAADDKGVDLSPEHVRDAVHDLLPARKEGN